MESTSTLNLIKVSQSTADELIQHKKGHWFTALPLSMAQEMEGRVHYLYAMFSPLDPFFDSLLAHMPV
jgi:hypothetical protein